MRTMFLIALIALAASQAEAEPPFQSGTSHFRCLSTPGRELLAAAIEHSRVIRTFVGEIEQSDVIVYLETLSYRSPRGPHGSMRFVTATGGMRYLLVQIDGYNLLPIEQIPMLGHELFHAIEVARTPWVHDMASLRRFYREIGIEWGADQFETANARIAEQWVRADVSDRRTREAAVPVHQASSPRRPQPEHEER